jgi:arylsulfatase A-like enzyme
VFPTLCELLGEPVPAQVDGRSLVPFLDGDAPTWWRDAAHWEYDYRDVAINAGVAPGWPEDRTLERMNLAVVRTDEAAYVQFGDGDSLCFDLAADPTWRTELHDPQRVLPLVRSLAAWRQEHLDRTYTDMLLAPGRPGRWPERAAKEGAVASSTAD